ncbi:hypothetical protein BH23GEM4_BH23GEM4_19340 [soil metagenome]|jgi:hypothetical protein
MEPRVPVGLTTQHWSAAEGRRFAFTVGAAFLVLAGVLWWRDREALAMVLASLGVLLLLAGLVVPRHLRPVYRAWMALGHALSRVTTPVVMGAIYFLVLTPMGLLMRALGRNPLVHGSTQRMGYWIPREAGRSDLERQF